MPNIGLDADLFTWLVIAVAGHQSLNLIAILQQQCVQDVCAAEVAS